MSTFVLVHGSWHDGSAWNAVIKRLEDHGHTAFGPTVAGHGKGVSKQVSHAQSTQSIVDFIVSYDLTDIVLVGHSYGGTIISKAAEVISDRIRRLVFCNGFVLNDGESITDAGPPYYRALFEQLAAASPDNTVMLPFEIWREAFINDADLALARWSYEAVIARAVSAAGRAPVSAQVLHFRYPAQLPQRHRGHFVAAGRMGLASPDVQPTRPVPARPNARQPRAHLFGSEPPGRQDY